MFLSFQTSTALFHDAVRVFSSALQELSVAGVTVEPTELKCSATDQRWPQGVEILQVIDKVANENNAYYTCSSYVTRLLTSMFVFCINIQKTLEGMTGPITFDEDGLRNDFYLEIVELSKDDGFKKIATWDPKNKVNITRALSDVYSQISQSIQNKTFTVVSRIGMPYLRIRYT